MSKISLKFTNKNGKFCLCALVTGTQTRHYRVVDVLKNPNFKKWNPTAQMFISKDSNDQQNNIALQQYLATFEQLLEEQSFETGKDLFAFYELKSREAAEQAILNAKQEMTLGEFIEEIIHELRYPTKRKPSSNFQPYNTLLHKLEKEKKLIKTPISKVDRMTFVHFSSWVLNQKGLKGTGKNYVALMKLLIAVVNRARKAGLTEYVPNFPYMDHAPRINKLTEKASELNKVGGTVKSLSPEQYEQFLALDFHKDYFKELYRDFCILLYEMKSRPMDIVKLHWDNIAYNDRYKRWTCAYIPSKKKNYAFMRENDTNPLTVQFISPRAMEIIMKYKGKSPAGYVFPFSFHKRKWNLDDPDQYNEYYVKQNRLQGRINSFLHTLGERFGLKYNLTLYAFRRSAITKAIIDNEMPVTMIAKVAGTSVKMIEHHYVNYLDALAAFQ